MDSKTKIVVVDVETLQNIVWNYYADNSRDLPWRKPRPDGIFDPYHILVSEVMLQQTQVARVIPKYRQFLKAFPNVESLAQASLGDVIKIWQGLGYNRRAKFLHASAQKIIRDFKGQIPEDLVLLESLPGIGKNTASAICVYAFNQPLSFIETNIRSVFIHHFFNDVKDVDDKEILPLVEKSIQLLSGQKGQIPIHQGAIRDTLKESSFRGEEIIPDGVSQYREWYWALMDYGSYLKLNVGNPNIRSRSYSKQSKFEGSKRQVRGAVLRVLSKQNMPYEMLEKEIIDPRLSDVLDDLQIEGFISQSKMIYSLT